MTNQITIKNIDELIEFVNRKDVSKNDALTVAENYFDVTTISFVNAFTGKTTFDKKDIISKIKETVIDKDNLVWLMFSENEPAQQ